MKPFRPLLAANAPDDLSTLRYPVLVSPKLDGIRAVVRYGKLLSRTLKPIPNKYIRAMIEENAHELEGFDGELIVGSPTAKDVFNRTTSAVMSQDGEPDFTFHVFDILAQGTYNERFIASRSRLSQLPTFVRFVRQTAIIGLAGLAYFERHYLRLGYEGVMLRDPNALYKFGRSTMKEGILLKLKRFEDDEATVIGFDEKMHNENELTKDERGYAKRSTKKANLKSARTLGALVCESERFTDVFKIGTGFDEALRKHIWKHRNSFRGKLVKFKFQRVGTIDAPRCPTFIGFRAKQDTSAD
jgi:DNA ligase-1